MTRTYKAFISYRHCPLDISVAEKLHKLIERYRVPRDLRRDGEKSLGIVFRDRDELPLSSNLTQDIFDALDNSEFLIVICTPDTPKSEWVAREIEYFISRHGHDHVLTIHAAGTPEESIPKQITHVYGKNGALLDKIEPLSAYIVDSEPRKVLRNLNKEFLRLVAAMLNCPYDSLKQRQKRYRTQQLLGAVGTVALVALSFVGILLSKNAEITSKNNEITAKNEAISEMNVQIQEQLAQSQLNESKALALLSQQQLEEGDRMGAIQTALSALPSEENQRPYSAAAEYALTEALYCYTDEAERFDFQIIQDTDISGFVVLEAQNCVITTDEEGMMRCFSLSNGLLLWEVRMPSCLTPLTTDSAYVSIHLSADSKYILYNSYNDVCIFSLADGTLMGEYTFGLYRYPCYAQDDTIMSISNSDIIDGLPCTTFQFLEPISGHLILQTEPLPGVNYETGALSIFSADGSRFLALLTEDIYTDEDKIYDLLLYVIDTASGEVLQQYRFEDTGGLYRALLLENGDFLVFYACNGSATAHRLTSDGALLYSTSSPMELPLASDYHPVYTPNVWDRQLECFLYRDSAYFVYDNYLCAIDLEDGTLLYGKNLDFTWKYCYRDFSSYLNFILSSGTVASINAGKSTSSAFSESSLGYSVSQTYGSTSLDCGIPTTQPNSIIVTRSTEDSNIQELEGTFFTDESLEYYKLFGDGFFFYSLDSGRYLLVDVPYDHENTGGTRYLLYNTETMTLEQTFTDIDSLTEFRNAYSAELSASLRYGDGTSPAVLQWWYFRDSITEVEFPYSLEDYSREAVCTGPNGLVMVSLNFSGSYKRPAAYAIYSTEDAVWTWLDNPCETEGYPATAVASQKKWVAFADYDGTLRIYDQAADAVIRELPLPVSPGNIEQMYFVNNDTALFLLQKNSKICVLDLEDGSELLTWELKNYSSAYGYFLLQEDLETGYLYVCDSSARMTGLRIHIASWTVTAEIPRMACYLAATGQFVRLDTSRYAPQVGNIYSLDDLIQMGNAVLSNGN